MNQSDILRACRNRTPDSFAPDGQPLRFLPVFMGWLVMGEEEADQWEPERLLALAVAGRDDFGTHRKQREA